jgi:hypothetical protein
MLKQVQHDKWGGERRLKIQGCRVLDPARRRHFCLVTPALSAPPRTLPHLIASSWPLPTLFPLRRLSVNRGNNAPDLRPIDCTDSWRMAAARGTLGHDPKTSQARAEAEGGLTCAVTEILTEYTEFSQITCRLIKTSALIHSRSVSVDT